MKTTVKRKKQDLKAGDIIYCEFYPPSKLKEIQSKYGNSWRFSSILRQISIYRLTMIIGFTSKRKNRQYIVLDYFGDNPEDAITVHRNRIIMQPRAKSKMPKPLEKLASRRKLEEKIKTIQKNFETR